MKVSVVIPVCDREKELRRSVQSVLAQSYSDFEVIVVENNSRDPSSLRKVVEDVGDERVRFYSLPDCDNANVARNFGVRQSTGDYVAFLDSDDEYYPDHLESGLHVLLESNADFLYGSIDIWDGFCRETRVARDFHAGERGLEYLFLNNGWAPTPTYIARRKVVEAINWDESLVRHQDFDFFLRVTSKFSSVARSRSTVLVNWARGEKRFSDGGSMLPFYHKWRVSMSRAVEKRFLYGKLKQCIKAKDFIHVVVYGSYWVRIFLYIRRS